MLDEFSFVAQVMRAETPVMSTAVTPEMAGTTQSATAVAVRRTFVPPMPSSASTYSTVIVAPFTTESWPLGAGPTGVVGIEPTYVAEPGGVCGRVTISGVGAVVERIDTVVVEAP